MIKGEGVFSGKLGKPLGERAVGLGWILWGGVVGGFALRPKLATRGAGRPGKASGLELCGPRPGLPGGGWCVAAC